MTFVVVLLTSAALFVSVVIGLILIECYRKDDGIPS